MCRLKGRFVERHSQSERFLMLMRHCNFFRLLIWSTATIAFSNWLMRSNSSSDWDEACDKITKFEVRMPINNRSIWFPQKYDGSLAEKPSLDCCPRTRVYHAHCRDQTFDFNSGGFRE